MGFFCVGRWYSVDGVGSVFGLFFPRGMEEESAHLKKKNFVKMEKSF